MTDREFIYQALEALENLVNFIKECGLPIPSVTYEGEQAITALNFFLKQPEQKPVLQNIEQYRIQMAGISTAAFGYWEENDEINPSYDTGALRDVSKLYSKYDELFKKKLLEKQWKSIDISDLRLIKEITNEYDSGYLDGVTWCEKYLKLRNK